MSKEKNLWALPESTGPGIQFQTEISDIAAALHSLQETASKLRISIVGQREEFSSFMVSVLDETNCFQIDELIPFEGNELLQPGVEIAIKVHNKGVKLWFDCTLLEAAVSEGIKSYICHFPKKIGLQQKRAHYRIGFRLLDRPSLSVKVGNSWLQRIKLCDLSPKGIGLLLTSLPDQMQSGEEIYCRMTLQNQEFPFHATITHISTKPRHRGYHIGLEFTEESLSTDFTRRLAKYMMGLQRQRIRNSASPVVED